MEAHSTTLNRLQKPFRYVALAIPFLVALGAGISEYKSEMQNIRLEFTGNIKKLERSYEDRYKALTNSISDLDSYVSTAFEQEVNFRRAECDLHSKRIESMGYG